MRHTAGFTRRQVLGAGMAGICGLAAGNLPGGAPEQPPLRYPAYLNVYELARPDSTFYHYQRLLGPLVTGDDSAKWGILTGIKEEIGEWALAYVNAQKIASVITSTFPVEGQDALQSITDLVGDCARVLHVEKPSVWIRNSTDTACYAASVSDKQLLVLTSRLLDLYEKRPAELRFIVGRELALHKLQALKLRRAACGVLAALQSIDLKVIPPAHKTVALTLALAWVLHWSRECEVVADRGGLLCCQDEKAAHSALGRLLHGLRADSSWWNPNQQEIDPAKLVQTVKRWEDEKLVDVVLLAKQWSAACPFVVDRVLALREWVKTGCQSRILERQQANPNDKQVVTIKEIQVEGLASGEDTVNPYVQVHNEHQRLLTTSAASKTKQARWPDLDAAVPLADGAPLFCEIWSKNTVYKDTFLGGFVVYPINPKHNLRDGRTVYRANIAWDWKARSSIDRRGVAHVVVAFSEKE